MKSSGQLCMNNCSILIVEDDYGIILKLTERLKALGYIYLFTAQTVRDAIDEFRDRKPNLLLVDIHLRGDFEGIKDGIGLTDRLKRERDVPVIFITADRSEETFRQAAKVFPCGYITKPIDHYQLWTTIELAFSNIRAEQRRAESVNPTSRVTVFVSYSRADKSYLRELRVHLKSLPSDRFEIWDDTRLVPGCPWRSELESKLVNARIAVMLVSPDFLASEFITKHELPTLLAAAEESGALVLYAILRPCRIPYSLGGFQSINPASRTISEMRRPERERVWVALADLIDSWGLGLAKSSR